MTATTTIYYIDPKTGQPSLIRTLQTAEGDDKTSIEVIRDGGKFKFENYVMNMIATTSDGTKPSVLEVDIANGSSFKIRCSRQTLTVDDKTDDPVTWSYSGSNLKLQARYPAADKETLVWELFNDDEPPIQLKIIVRRI